MRPRNLAFALLGIACVTVPAVYVFRVRQAAIREASSSSPPPATSRGAPPGTPSGVQPPAGAAAGPPVAFRYTGPGDTYGRLVTAELGASADSERATVLRCDRLDMAAGHGVCLTAQRGVFTTYEAVLFDADFRPRHTVALSGVPSRTRLSPDGRLAAMTVFESGHSYAAGQFSTRTSIIDALTGNVVVPDLERFKVLRDGQVIESVDFNFWGVTFARDDNRFYATLATEGRTYLVAGDVRAREVRVVRGDVECPSLSPDGGRIAFKRRQGGGLTPVTWRLSVLRLDTLDDWPLAETRSVDDQVAWLDDAAVVYALPAAAAGTAATDTWAVPADGTGSPHLVMPNAYSLVVVRGGAPSALGAGRRDGEGVRDR